MSDELICRRDLLAGAAAAVGAMTAAATGAGERSVRASGSAAVRYCLNTGTIRGQKLSLEQEIDIAAQAGYDAIEPWVDKIHQYRQAGGRLSELRKRIEDHGLTVESAISFFRWIVDDPTERAKGLEQAKRDMDVLAQIGAKRIAAPPAGATRGGKIELARIAERYGQLLQLGQQMAVVPQLELWGFSQNLCRLGECMYVVLEAGYPNASLLPDVFHIYKGGSSFEALRFISARAIGVLHLNDYPAQPARDRITDRDRVMPGDGVAPLEQVLRYLYVDGRLPVLSLELFNPAYWRQDPLQVARTGLAKMKSSVRRALGGS